MAALLFNKAASWGSQEEPGLVSNQAKAWCLRKHGNEWGGDRQLWDWEEGLPPSLLNLQVVGALSMF
jgi:hypothetical protein